MMLPHDAKSFVRPWVFLWLLVGSVACSTPSIPTDKPHHTADGFINPQQSEQTGFTDFLKWRRERAAKEIPGPEAYDFTLAQPDITFLQNNRATNTVTWIGHATLLLQIDGHNILTDPQFSQRASPVQWAGPQRVVQPAIAIEDLPPIDYVVISHDHYDSLDVGSIRGLLNRPGGQQTTFVVPLKLKPWFQDLGAERVVELDWWESFTQGRATLTAVPAQHWSKRSVFSRNKTLWAGWVIETPAYKVFFCGDTGYHQPMFQEIAARHGPFDLAAIPIGAYEPRWFMKSKHLNPEEAVKVHRDVKAEQSIAIHWGTFILTDEPLTEPPVKLRQALKAAQVPEEVFRVMQHGETMTLPSNDQRVSSH